MVREFRHTFRAMGTEITLVAVTSAPGRRVTQLLRRVRHLFRHEEARFSRFRQDSELSRLNRAGHLDDPSPEFWDVLQRARTWWERTRGMFDPTVLHAIARAGYDRSFEDVLHNPPSTPVKAGRAGDVATGFRHVELAGSTGSRGRRCVRLTNGVGVDLGGIVKGWTADRAARLMNPFEGFMVDAGGDIMARGNSPETPGWCVALEDPFDAFRHRDYVLLRDAALATSGTYRRTWLTTAGERVHHLIDPRTSAPAETDSTGATILASTVEQAEVLAKVVLLLGSERGIPLAEAAEGVEASVVLVDGTTRVTSRWPGIAARPDIPVVDRACDFR